MTTSTPSPLDAKTQRRRAARAAKMARWRDADQIRDARQADAAKPLTQAQREAAIELGVAILKAQVAFNAAKQLAVSE